VARCRRIVRAKESNGERMRARVSEGYIAFTETTAYLMTSSSGMLRIPDANCRVSAMSSLAICVFDRDARCPLEGR